MNFTFLAFVLAYGGPQWFVETCKFTYNCILRPGLYDDQRGRLASANGPRHPKVQGVTHEYHTVNGLKIHVARAGIGADKPFILFLHGFPEFWYSWRRQLTHLQREYEVAAVDLPGYNASSKPEARAALLSGNVCAALAGVALALGRRRILLVGHDWGGALAFDMAALFPDLVERVAVLSAVPSGLFRRNMDLGQLRRSYYMYAFQQPHVPEAMFRQNDYRAIEQALRNPTAGGCVRSALSDDEIALYKDAAAQPGALTCSINYYRAAMMEGGVMGRNAEVRAAWRAPLRMPVMLLLGDSDKFLSLNLLAGVGQVARDVSVHVVPNCSHWMQQDAPDAVNHLLELFFTSNLPTARL